MSFKLHIFTHDQDNVQIPSIVSIIVYNMYLEASEMCVWGVTTSLRALMHSLLARALFLLYGYDFY